MGGHTDTSLGAVRKTDSPNRGAELKSNKGTRSLMHKKHWQREGPYTKLLISKTGRLFRSNLGANCFTAERS